MRWWQLPRAQTYLFPQLNPMVASEALSRNAVVNILIFSEQRPRVVGSFAWARTDSEVAFMSSGSLPWMGPPAALKWGSAGW